MLDRCLSLARAIKWYHLLVAVILFMLLSTLLSIVPLKAEERRISSELEGLLEFAKANNVDLLSVEYVGKNAEDFYTFTGRTLPNFYPETWTIRNAGYFANSVNDEIVVAGEMFDIYYRYFTDFIPLAASDDFYYLSKSSAHAEPSVDMLLFTYGSKESYDGGYYSDQIFNLKISNPYGSAIHMNMRSKIENVSGIPALMCATLRNKNTIKGLPEYSKDGIDFLLFPGENDIYISLFQQIGTENAAISKNMNHVALPFAISDLEFVVSTGEDEWRHVLAVLDRHVIDPLDVTYMIDSSCGLLYAGIPRENMIIGERLKTRTDYRDALAFLGASSKKQIMISRSILEDLFQYTPAGLESLLSSTIFDSADGEYVFLRTTRSAELSEKSESLLFFPSHDYISQSSDSDTIFGLNSYGEICILNNNPTKMDANVTFSTFNLLPSESYLSISMDLTQIYNLHQRGGGRDFHNLSMRLEPGLNTLKIQTFSPGMMSSHYFLPVYYMIEGFSVTLDSSLKARVE